MRFFTFLSLAFVWAARLYAFTETTGAEAVAESKPRVKISSNSPTFAFNGLFTSGAPGTPPSGYESSYRTTPNSGPALAFYPFGKPQTDRKGKKPPPFKPSVQVGVFGQIVGAANQDRTTAEQDEDPNFNRRYDLQMMIYRCRLLAGGRISPKTSFFFETEVPVPVGYVNPNGTKEGAVGIILLDALVEHIFHNSFSVVAGKQWVGINRNSLQTAAGLLALDFGYYQNPYGIYPNQPLQNNFGRDLGIQARGFFAKDRFEYRVGVFRGGASDVYSPPRFTGRVSYNFLGKEKDLYFIGTTLGQGKLFALGAGFDVQKSYVGFACDAFLDVPLGDAGSVTCNVSYTHLDGGTSKRPGSFTQLIPRQNVLFGELGYYIKEIKVQPFIGYEGQLMNGRPIQYGLPDNISPDLLKGQNTLHSLERIVGGLNYYIAGYNMNVKAQYGVQRYGRTELNGEVKMQQRSEFWFQMQFFIF